MARNPKLGLRIAAVIFGVLLTTVQIRQIPKIPMPFTAEAIGYDIVWIALLAAGIYMLLYGLKIVGRNIKRESNL